MNTWDKEAQKRFNEMIYYSIEDRKRMKEDMDFMGVVPKKPNKIKKLYNWITGLRIVHKDRIEDE